MESQVLEWLNENQYRSYPLIVTEGKELKLAGQGEISVRATAAHGGYLVRGFGTDFPTQISVGDDLEFTLKDGTSVKSEIIAFDISDPKGRIYIKDDYSAQAYSTSTDYYICKKNMSMGSESGKVDLSLEAMILDANLLFTTAPGGAALLKFEISGADLLVTVEQQSIFTVTNYKAASYPYYSRNTEGSLLVFGEEVKRLVSGVVFVNQYFQPSVCTYYNAPWLGVASLQFNTASPLTGAITFEEGYQLSLEITEPSTLAISAGKLEGLPVGCEKLFEGLIPDDCSTMVSSINSVQASIANGNFNLSAGQNVAIFPSDSEPKIYIGLTFNKDDVCKNPLSKPVTQI